MTPQEFRKELIAFRSSIGPNAYVTAGICGLDWGAERGTLDCTVYPDGLTRSGESFTVYAEDWDALLYVAKKKWDEHQSEYQRQTVRKMALAIIKITAEIGQCTDAALRDKFSETQIKHCGKLAVADANKIAANGPFDIVKIRGANGAPADAVARDPARVQ